MKTLWVDEPFAYDGTQLRSLFAYLNYRVLGDSIISWRGPCDVSFDHMVDGEDVLSKSQICGSDMVHFIVEKFDEKLSFGVAIQRIMASLTLDILRELSLNQKLIANLRRDGDDVFSGERKLSISIATVSPVSTLVHFAVNNRNEGTPVPTVALLDFGIDPQKFAQVLLERTRKELLSIQDASMKVRWVK